MSNSSWILPHYTYNDYVHWEGRWELIDGIPYAMSPLPVPKHQWLAANISSEFINEMKGCKHCKVYHPIDYRVSDDTIIQPDMLIVCGEIEKEYLDFAPALVVEILSPATALKDRHSKYSIYETQLVKYYLIISLDLEEVEVYELDGNKYKLQQKGHDFSFGFSFDKDCFANISFKEIWQ